MKEAGKMFGLLAPIVKMLAVELLGSSVKSVLASKETNATATDKLIQVAEAATSKSKGGGGKGAGKGY
ncbi:MAG: hypothetical protein FVQ81_14525 [Candidatus Glassbacteria bacterium]|nr:hypothetical protein [Candidatus Glassbacteria bacterium]